MPIKIAVQPTEPPGTPPIVEPANSIENAFAMFIVAFRFYEACLNKRIDSVWFGNRRVLVFTGDKYDPAERPGITIQPEQYTYDKLSTQAYNLLFAAMGNMAAVVYEAAANDAKLRDLNKSPADYNDTERIIEIIFQIRNGFAHRPHAPNWRVNPARQNHYIVTVEGIKIDIDFRALNGVSISPSHFGGYEGFIAMCRHLHTAVKAAVP
jgi:hypothetical protein